MSDTAEKLIERAVAGDGIALQELLLQHFDRLRLHLHEKMPADLTGQIAVEDVLQETFAESVRQIAGFKAGNDTAFFRWLATIAEHRLIDLVRAARAAKRGGGWSPVDAAAAPDRSIAELITLLAVHERTPSRSIAGREVATALQAAVESLKDDYREVLTLRYFQGLSVTETAARMGRSSTAVQMLCHRAIEELRERMGDPDQFFSRDA